MTKIANCQCCKCRGATLKNSRCYVYKRKILSHLKNYEIVCLNCKLVVLLMSFLTDQTTEIEQTRPRFVLNTRFLFQGPQGPRGVDGAKGAQGRPVCCDSFSLLPIVCISVRTTSSMETGR